MGEQEDGPRHLRRMLSFGKVENPFNMIGMVLALSLSEGQRKKRIWMTPKGLKPLPCKAFSKASPILEVEVKRNR
jgi:hypothetical protein